MTNFFVGEEVQIDGTGFTKFKNDKVYIISKIEDKLRNPFCGESYMMEFVTEMINKETRQRISCCIAPAKLKHARVGSKVVGKEEWEQPNQIIAKPILEERKIGKVKMQLFDEGFPNAVMEIAKVMSWAEQNKGYKPNDFKNLPNADVEFSAAASRHKLKGLIQKDAGLPPLERVDEESGIVHLAHQCFNALAELELVLTGRIKE